MEPNPGNSTGGAASSIGKFIVIGLVTGGLAGVGGGVATLYGPQLMEKPVAAEEPVVEASSSAVKPDEDKIAAPVTMSGIASGFRMGSIPGTEAVKSIRITLAVDEEGAALKEPLDVHLGMGFPLRLYPLGGLAREPAFAAFPKSSTLPIGATAIEPGQEASFEFLATQTVGGLDVLKTTPQLLKDVTASELKSIGIACQGLSNWVLDGYRIEVNGKLFAEHGGMDVQVQPAIGTIRNELGLKLPAQEALVAQMETLEAYVTTGLATDEEKADLEKLKKQVAEAAVPVRELAGQASGATPWFVEDDPAFKPAAAADAAVKALRVTLVTGGGDQPGTRNPVYLKAGGAKFLLSSETDPLEDGPKPQRFELTPADLKQNPLTTKALDRLGIGVIANDERFSTTPDRARLQRVLVEADGKTVYDSELKPSDRRVLKTLWLIPPAHLDGTGNVVTNESQPSETSLWTPGMKGDTSIAVKPPPPPVVKKEPKKKDSKKTDTSVAKKSTKKDAKAGSKKGVAKKGPTPTPTPTPPINTLGTGGRPILTRTNSGGFPIFGPPLRRTGLFPFQQQPVNTLGSLASAAATILNALRPVPTPQGPTLADIQINPINPVRPIIVDQGGPFTVQWTATGNIAAVSRYEVTLFGVLPHQGTPFLVPAISNTVSVPAGVRFASIPTLRVANLTSLTPLQRLQLYVRPQVSAVLTNGTRVTQLGSLLPVFPAGTNAGNISLVRGPAVPPIQDVPFFGGTGGFQLLNSPGATFTQDGNSVWGGHSGWISLGAADTNTVNHAWQILTEQDTLAALRFANHEAPRPFLAPFAVHNTGLRPARDAPGPPGTPPTTLVNDQAVMLQFDGQVTYNPATARGFRLIGHAVFMGTRSVASATVNARLRVGLGSVVQDLDGNFVNPAVIPNAPPFFSLAQTPVTYTKNTAGGNAVTTALLIDLPYRPDRFVSANLARTVGAYVRDMLNVAPAGHPDFPNMRLGNSQNLTFNGGNFWPGPPAVPNAPFPPFPPFDNPPLPAPPPFAFFAPPFPAANALPTTVWVTANIWVQMQSSDTSATDAIGIMGLRIVPDNTP